MAFFPALYLLVETNKTLVAYNQEEFPVGRSMQILQRGVAPSIARRYLTYRQFMSPADPPCSRNEREEYIIHVEGTRIGMPVTHTDYEEAKIEAERLSKQANNQNKEVRIFKLVATVKAVCEPSIETKEYF